MSQFPSSAVPLNQPRMLYGGPIMGRRRATGLAPITQRINGAAANTAAPSLGAMDNHLALAPAPTLGTIPSGYAWKPPAVTPTVPTPALPSMPGLGGDAGMRLQKLQDAANQANQNRYGDLLTLNEQSGGQMMDVLSNEYNRMFGLAGSGEQSALERERRQAQVNWGKTNQSATNRGIGNTTVLDSLDRAVIDDSALRSQEISDKANQQRIDLSKAYSQDAVNTLGSMYNSRSGIMERKTDAGPDLSLYAQLASQAGAGAGAGGSGSGGDWGYGTSAPTASYDPNMLVSARSVDPYYQALTPAQKAQADKLYKAPPTAEQWAGMNSIQKSASGYMTQEEARQKLLDQYSRNAVSQSNSSFPVGNGINLNAFTTGGIAGVHTTKPANDFSTYFGTVANQYQNMNYPGMGTGSTPSTPSTPYQVPPGMTQAEYNYYRTWFDPQYISQQGKAGLDAEVKLYNQAIQAGLTPQQIRSMTKAQVQEAIDPKAGAAALLKRLGY